MTRSHGRLLILLSVIVFIPVSFCFGKLYPVYIKGYDRLTKTMLERMADDKMVACQPAGCVAIRDETNSPIVFFADPGGNCFQFFKYRNMYPGEDTFRLSAFGDWGDENGEYKIPNDITTCEEGYQTSQLYIVDTDNNRIARGIFDNYYFAISPQPPIGTSIGLNNPLGIGVCPTITSPKIYIADTKNHRIVRTSIYGDLEQTYGSYGSGIGCFNMPHDVARKGSFVYIADTYNDRIVALLEHQDGSFEWWNAYDLSENYTMVTSVDCDQNGNVYCVDKTFCKIVKLSEGLAELLWSIGTRGIAVDQYQSPRSIAVSKSCSDVIVNESYTEYTGIRFLENRIDIMTATVFPQQFDATILGEQTQISFKIDDVARVYVEILENGDHVRWVTPEDGLMLPAGSHAESFLIWDGADDAGNLCLPGEYMVKVAATDAYDNTAIKTISIKIEGTRVPGTLDEVAHWTLDGEPYVLISDVRLAANGRLEIDPGVKIMPTGNYGILPPVYWNGSIFARGSAANKILFTPHRKLYPEFNSVAKGFWKGIDFRIGAAWHDTLVLDHCVIEAAGSDSAAVWCKVVQYVSITNTTICRSGMIGLYCNHQCDTVVVNNCQFEDNDSIPLIAAFKHIGEINDNDFSSNKPDVIAIKGETRSTNAIIANQGVPYWFLKGNTWEFKVMSSGSGYCPTLIIEPGVSIYFQDSTGLYAQQRGRIIAQGTQDNMVVFTALDTTRHWRGIHVNDNNPVDTSRFEYCEISYGGNKMTYPYDAGQGNLSFMSNTIAYVLENCQISHSTNYGVGDGHGFETDTMVSIVKNNTFTANDSFPLIISSTEFNQCDNNQFVNNGINKILIKNGGVIAQSTIIKNQGAPYVIDCWFEVADRLDIEVGNIMQCRGNHYWSIKSTGVLKATDVTFTAYDTVWWGMKFDNCQFDTSTLDNCIIEKARYYGGLWPAGAVAVHNSLMRISNSAILNNEKGIYVVGQSKLNLTGNLIAQNNCGLHTWDCSYLDTVNLHIRNNDFTGNKLAMQTNCWPTGGLDVCLNWWGDATGPWDPVLGDPLYNPAGRGDSIGAHIDYEPWLASPVHPVDVTLLQPNGGETLYGGCEYEIKWARAVTASRQELYYTIDYPEGGSGGGKESADWRFIDTVRVDDVSYLWRVPNTASQRCRVAIKIYHDNGQDHELKNSQSRRGEIRYSSDQGAEQVSLDISDANFIIPVTTDFSLSTAYNNGRKILTSPRGNKVYFLYANEGWSVPAGVYYCYSADSGRNFRAPERINASGVYPALGVNSMGNPCAAWVAGSAIYYSRWSASWVPPDTIILPVENVSPPSMMVDGTNTVHLVFTQYYWLPSDVGDLLYVKFPYADFQAAVYETLLTDNFCKTPSIVVDEAGSLHLLWQGNQCLCYRMKDAAGWFDIDTIYTTLTNANEPLYPAIDLYGSKITVVWQDQDALSNWEIFSRMKEDIGWTEIKQVTTTLGESRFPVLAGANYCLWQDNSSGAWDVYKSEYVDIGGFWTTPENISNSPEKSAYPHGAYALVDPTTAKLYCLWTEGDTIPYTIEFEQLVASPQPIVFIDLGQSIQSPYCLSRDGYWLFGARPYESVDWGYNNLLYKFTNLDSTKQYRLELSCYFENNPQLDIAINTNQGGAGRRDELAKQQSESEEVAGIGRIIQVLVIDSVPLDTSFITPNKLHRVSVWLPKETYADGEITNSIVKIKGKVVVCGEIGLFEFGQDQKEAIVNVSGPMGEEAIISPSFFASRLYPNPAKGILKIRFNSPIERKVTMQLYDAAGRQIQQREFIGSSIGISEVLIPLVGISAGVYFVRLKSANYEKIEKVILLR